MRTPDEIMTEFDEGLQGLADHDMHGLLWEILADVTDSYNLAMHQAGIASDVVESVTTTVMDYLANHYGDD